MKFKDKELKLSRKTYYTGGALLTILFLLSNFVTYLGTQKVFSGTQNVYDLLNPARAFIDPKDLIINIQPLRDELTEIGIKDPRVSIYFEFLNTGANIAVNKDADYYPASLLKLPISMAVTKKIEQGEWNWGNELVLMSSDKDDKFGQLYKKPLGTKVTLEELVKQTLQQSDNTANSMLVRNLEPAEFQDVYDHLGLEDFMSDEGKISAKKYSVIFRSLYNAAYLSEDNSERLLQYLGETPFGEYVESGLPEGVKFSHKIGVSDERSVFLDSGIVYLPNRPYILTVMIATGDHVEAQRIMKDISSRVYNYIVSYK